MTLVLGEELGLTYNNGMTVKCTLNGTKRQRYVIF